MRFKDGGDSVNAIVWNTHGQHGGTLFDTAVVYGGIVLTAEKARPEPLLARRGMGCPRRS